MNSEKKFNCWSIENPVTKTLQKSMTLTFAPKETLTLVVVLNTPMTVSCADLLAKLVFCHVPDREDSQFGEEFTIKRVTQVVGNCETLIEKRVGRVERTMTTLLCGKLQNPVLVC